METRSETDRIAEVLDRHQPGWEIEWAAGDELREYVRKLHSISLSPVNQDRARTSLKRSVGQRVFHRVLNAALEAGIVRMPEILPPTHVHVEGQDDGF